MRAEIVVGIDDDDLELIVSVTPIEEDELLISMLQ
jgi:hypothetical protein